MSIDSKKDFRVLLLNPPSGKDGAKFIREGRCQQELGVWTTVWPPVSLALTGSILKEKDYEIKIIDCPIENVDWKLLELIIKEYRPSFILSSISTPTLESDLNIVKIAKSINSKIKVAIFGVHVTELPEDAFKIIDGLDFVIRGEPEITVSSLVDCIHSSGNIEDVRGITFKKVNKVFNNPDRGYMENLDELPFPAWSEVDRERYRMPISGDKFLLAVPHRGCPYNCIFCASKPYYGRKTRFRTPSRFVDELQWVGDEFGIRDFLFWAETYTISKEFVMNVNWELINRQLRIRWVCNSRVDTIDGEMMVSMKQAGCWMVGYGIESGNQKILDMAGKRITLEQIENTVKLTKKHGLTTTGHIIIGLPGESKETVMQTIRFVNSLPLDFAQFYTAAPWPGTELYKYAIDTGILKSLDFREFTQQKGVMETETFTAEEMAYYCKLAYRKFYGRAKIVAQIAKRMLTPKNLCHTLSTFVSFFLKGSGKG